MGEKRYIITHSLLSSWLWSCNSDGGGDDFVSTLRKEKRPQSQAMLDGIAFESLVNAAVSDKSVKQGINCYNGVKALYGAVNGSAMQVKLSKEITVGGIDILLYGIADYVKAGTIYDCKFSKRYYNGKYLNSTQHPLYLECLPEAYRFVYLSSDGEYMWREEYRREDAPSIIPMISDFFKYIKKQNLFELYCQNWQTKY